MGVPEPCLRWTWQGLHSDAPAHWILGTGPAHTSGAFCSFTGLSHYSSYLHSADHRSPFHFFHLLRSCCISWTRGLHFFISIQSLHYLELWVEDMAHLHAVLTGELLTPSNVLIFTSMMESFILFQRCPSCGLCCLHPSALLTPPLCSPCRVQVCSCSLQKTRKCPSSSITQWKFLSHEAECSLLSRCPGY